MQKCNECERKFPEHLIQPLFAKGTYTPMCPICALRITNEIHGINRKEFHGTMANQYLKEAKRHVQKNV